MFGHHDDSDQNNQPQDAPVQDQASADHVEQVVHPGDVPVPSDPAAPADESPWQHPGTPLGDASSQPPAPEPPQPEPVSAPTPPPLPQNDEPLGADGLVDIRQKALGDLSPLIGHLEHQTPEEKFQVTMMMIQANDDKSLVPAAYEAAQQISDEKVRAQALLDIVQEINYFTQHSADGQP